MALAKLQSLPLHHNMANTHVCTLDLSMIGFSDTIKINSNARRGCLEFPFDAHHPPTIDKITRSCIFLLFPPPLCPSACAYVTLSSSWGDHVLICEEKWLLKGAVWWLHGSFSCSRLARNSISAGLVCAIIKMVYDEEEAVLKSGCLFEKCRKSNTSCWLIQAIYLNCKSYFLFM